MDAKKYIERVLEDEGLTGGLPDDAGKAVVDWALAALKSRIEPIKDQAKADAENQRILQVVRTVTAVAEALIDGDPAKAQAAWKAAGGAQAIDPLFQKTPAQIVAQLFAWKATANV